MTSLPSHQKYLWILVLCTIILSPIISLPRDSNYDDIPDILHQLVNESNEYISQQDSILLVYVTSQNDRIKKLERSMVIHWLLFTVAMSFLTILLYQSNKHQAFNINPVESSIHPPHRIPVLSGRKTKYIDIAEITHCLSSISYTEIYCLDGSHYSLSKNISKIEGELSGFGFFRTHRSAVVNLKYIKSINENKFIELNTGIQVPVAKSRLPSLRKAMKQNT